MRKNKIYYSLTTFLSIILLISCNDAPTGSSEAEKAEKNNTEKTSTNQEVIFTRQQFDALDMKVDTLQKRNMAGFVAANGQLEVPPQSEASVTTVIGANVSDILVIEGDQVKKGETIAFISHPDMVRLQTDYLNAFNEYHLQQKEFARQKRLYEEGVGSGETFQRTEAAMQNSRGKLTGLKSQLELLNLNPARIEKGNIYKKIPVVSPIDGAIEKVNIQTGQYVQAQTPMFEIVNTHHVHADLMVFEKDVSKVKVGQSVNFTVESMPEVELKAKIISMSKTFEEEPKAVHVHAEINSKPDNLIPGMYVKGRININNIETTAFPESAIATAGETSYVFKAEKNADSWRFIPVKVVTGETVNGWTPVEFLSEVAPKTQFVYNNAYYLMAEMQKGQGGHGH